MSRQHVYWQNKITPCVLNLDRDFCPAKDHIDIHYKSFNFKGGEPHIQLEASLQYLDELLITQRVNSVEDVFMIVMAADAAHRMGFKKLRLFCPYFPAARQDRICNPGEAFTVKLFAKMINDCGFDKVTIFSPHSEVTPALVNNCDEMADTDKEMVLKIVQEISGDGIVNIVSPDAGAEKRVGKIVQYLISKNCKVNLVIGGKKRDVATGHLLGFHVLADDLQGYPTLIVDDILCMGGTFMGLGNLLKEKNCGKLFLYTSHADCEEGLIKMTTYFDRVYTTNSRKNWGDIILPLVGIPDTKLTCFNLEY